MVATLAILLPATEVAYRLLEVRSVKLALSSLLRSSGTLAVRRKR